MLLLRGLSLLAQSHAEPTPFAFEWFQLHKWDLGATIVVAVLLTVVGRRWSRHYRRRAGGGGGDAAGGGRRRGGRGAPRRDGDRPAFGDHDRDRVVRVPVDAVEGPRRRHHADHRVG